MNKRYIYAGDTKNNANTRDDTNKDEPNKTIINPKYI